MTEPIDFDPSRGPTCLYRMFDTDGRLLYVGISSRGAARLADHRRGKSWWTSVATVSVEHFATFDEARSRESEAIVAERPAHNIAGTSPNRDARKRSGRAKQRRYRVKSRARTVVHEVLLAEGQWRTDDDPLSVTREFVADENGRKFISEVNRGMRPADFGSEFFE